MPSVEEIVRSELLLNISGIVVLKIPPQDRRGLGNFIVLLCEIRHSSTNRFIRQQLLYLWVEKNFVVGVC